MTREIPWQEKSHGKRNHMAKRPMARERRKVKLVMATPAAPFTQSFWHLLSAAVVSASAPTSTLALPLAMLASVLGGTVLLALGHCVQFGPVHLTDCHD